MGEPYYRYHLFFCVNTRDDGGPCCGDAAAQQLRDYAKQRIGELGDAVPESVRVNTAGCMNRCSEGPVMVVYPEGVWYRYRSREDIDEIITEHLCNQRPVARLRI